jgi:pimeloyl-ACP methyl ester carboxylesterase
MAPVKQIEPLARLLRFEAGDGLELSGLLYEPRKKSERAVVWLHGTGGASVFDSRRTNLLADAFIRRGFAFFPFNNRGAHVMGRGTGMAYELIRECVLDIDGAVRELRARGYRDLTLVGHSTGANKVAVYDHHKPRNRVQRYVLLAGGDDTGLSYERLGAKTFRMTLDRARRMLRARRGMELVPPTLAELPMSWRAFYDMNNPDGDYNVFPFGEVLRGRRLSRRPLFRHIKGMRKPTLAVYGENDEYSYGDPSRCVAILADAIGPKPNIELTIMAGADHGFHGREREVAELIGDWAEG